MYSVKYLQDAGLLKKELWCTEWPLSIINSAFTACCASCSVRVWGGRGLPCVGCRLWAWLRPLLY